jgi:hemerythrin
MAFFNWEDHFNVGIREIDTQHQKLVQMLNELYEAMKAGKGNDAVGKILNGMIQYTVSHFATEERYMKLHGYPDFDTHKKEHDSLTKQVSDLQEQFKTGQAALSMKVGNFLKSWLINHISGTDMKYAPLLRAKGVK